MSNMIVDFIKEKAIFLNNLSKDEEALFNYINTNQDNLEEIIQQYKPETVFKPVNTLRFLIANELKKGNKVDVKILDALKLAIEERDISVYYNFNETVNQSLSNYKQSKKGMFPNWGNAFNVLFPFLYNNAVNAEVNIQLERLADEVIQANQLENVSKHIVSFLGSNNYGSDHTWVAIIPETAPSVQYAYQIFFTINKNGVVGGLHKGHSLTKQVFSNQDLQFNNWENYIEHTQQTKEEWLQLNSAVNFILLNDEKALIKAVKQVDAVALADYFKVLDKLKEDLDIQDEEKLVFSTSSNRLSFHVGKRYCLNVNKALFDYISYIELEEGNSDRETFTASETAYLYKNRNSGDVYKNYEVIKSAIEIEIERDNHALAKSYDNSAFRKAVFNLAYRNNIIQNNEIKGKPNNYWGLGFNSNIDRLNLFKKEGYWQAIDYKKGDTRAAAKRARKLFEKIQTGDYVIIKGYGGSHDLIVHYKGEVVSKDEENERLELKEIKGALYKGKAPRGTGAGNWHDTIVQVKRQEDIKLLFENMVNIKTEFIEWLILNSSADFFNKKSDTLSENLDYYNTFFNIDIFNVSKSSYKNVIAEIENIAYNDDTSAFFKFSKVESNHVPRAIIGRANYFKFLGDYFNESDEIKNEDDTYIGYTAPLNQILYGPPGTGKTYNTVLEAAKIIEQNETLSYAEALQVFNTHLGKRIEFITFHQNYSYEDFVQGLRPDVDQLALSFNREDGLFAKIATNALFEYYKVHQKESKLKKSKEDVSIDINEAYIEFFKSLTVGQEFETKTGMTVKVVSFTDRQNIEFKPDNGVKSYLVSGNRLLKLYEVFPDINKIERVHEDIREAIGGCNSSIYYVALREFISFLDSYKETVDTFEDKDEADFDYDDISYQRKKDLLTNVNLSDLRKVDLHKVPKYVIIIDEINRANISRVFGELITLLEHDKRSHGQIPLKVKLPSSENFIVPSNLYVIGTMNTADKSIALLDIALRRRFEFVAMYPKYELTDREVHKKEFLKTLNNEIVASGKGHDFTIGHAYFMGDDFNFKSVINNKVIPLLLEYFMNDEKEVQRVLANSGIKVEGWPMEMITND
ncbi:McrB family protein [Pseudotamlana agarivorans]|uniref:McrB family protein n=1 Tax=Pseudotamlana agarivorans TaxID=481183 RepID=UPI00083585FB|nr:AAA family ATPase [Tamlana agarivorans]